MLQQGRDALQRLSSILKTPKGRLLGRFLGVFDTPVVCIISAVKPLKSTLRRKGAVLVTVCLLVPLSVLFIGLTPGKTSAATSSTLTFQGRLLSSSGTTVPDGTYNMQFNLYTASSGGTTQWTDTRLNNASQGITVKNGYFSVNLGDTTVGGTAFPSTINWDQEQWLGMTVRGTGSCSFGACSPTDSEMTPRFKLTAVPYATVAGSLQKTSGANELKVTTATPTADVTYLFQDAAAGTYNVCTSANNCTSLGAYIQNGTAAQNTANFNIQSAAIGSVTAKFRALGSQAADVLQVRDSTDVTTVFSVNPAGNTTIGGTLAVNGNTTLGDASGDTLTVNASTASIPNNLNIDSNTLFIDATSNFVGVNMANPAGVFSVQLPQYTSRNTDSQHIIVSNSGDTNSGLHIGFDGVANKAYLNVINPSVSWGTLVLQDDIDGGGKVSIGTATPSHRLTVNDRTSGIKSAVTYTSASAAGTLAAGEFTTTNSSGTGAITYLYGNLITATNSSAGGVTIQVGADVTSTTSAGTVGYFGGIRGVAEIQGSAAVSSQMYGFKGEARLASNATVAPTIPLVGVRGEVISNSATLTAPNLYAIQAIPNNGGAGTVQNLVGLYVSAPSNYGVINNAYGIFIENHMSATNDYGLYIQGADTYALWSDSGANRLDGVTTIGTGLTAGDALTVTNASSTGNIFVAQDNGSPVFVIADGGGVTVTQGSGSDLFTIFTGNLKVGSGTPSVTLNGEDAYVEGTFEVDGSVQLDGALTANSTATFNGSTTFGDTTSDTITFTGRLNSTVNPSANDTYDLGSDSLRWANLYLGGETIHLGTSTSDEAAISYTTATDTLLFKNATNSMTALQIQNSSSAALLNLDTTNAVLTVNAIQESISQYNNPNGGIGQTQNLVTYSEQFNHANWTKTNVTNTASDTVAGPDNYAAFASPLAADTLTATAANGTITQTFTTATNGNYNFSVWLKTSSGTQSVNLRIDSTGATPTTGTAQNYTVGTTWQRYFVTQNFTGTPSNIKPTIQIVTNGGAIIAYGAQLSQTSQMLVYTRTASAAQTQNQGVISNGGLLAVSLNATDVPLMVRGAPSQSNDLVQILDSSNSLLLSVSSGGNLGIGLTNAGNKFVVQDTTVANGSPTILMRVNAGSDGTLGSLGYLLGFNVSATGSSRYGYLGFGDNVAMRTMVLNSNAAGAFGNVSIGQTANTYPLDVAGNINSTTGYRFNGTAGSTTTCTSGNVIANATIQGGIMTAGTCTAAGSGTVTGSGSANRIAYWSGASALTSSSTFLFDGTNMGVGTTSTGKKLEVIGDILSKSADTAARAVALSFSSANASAQAAIWTNNSYAPASPSAGWTEVMTFYNSKIGIGITSPASLLTVHTGTGKNFGSFDVGGVTGIGAFNDAFSAWNPLSVNAGGAVYLASGNVSIGSSLGAPSGSQLTVGTTTTNAVNLGTSDPATGMWIRNDGSNTVISTNVGSMYYGYSGSSKNLYFYNGGTTARLTIDTGNTVSTGADLRVGGNLPGAGWIGAGCEGYCNSSGGYALLYADGHADFGDGTNAIQIYPGNGGARISVNGQGVNQPYIGFAGNNSAFGCPAANCGTRFSSNVIIYGTGTDCTIGNGTGTTSCSSDSRLKHDIQGTTGNLAKVMQLEPVSFYTNLDPANKRIGLIAQNVLTQFPEAVTTDSQGYYQLDYGVLVSPLIGAVKELKVHIDDIDARLSVLEAGNFSGNLHVDGNTDFLGNLTVQGTATFKDLIVVGDTTVTQLTVDRLISHGDAPTGVLGATTGYNSSVTIEGNDTAGSIIYTAGSQILPAHPLAAGDQITVTFKTPYVTTPRVVLTPTSEKAANVRYYVQRTGTEFKLVFTDVPVAGDTYSFDYQVIQ